MTRASVVVVAYRSLEHLRHGLPPLLADPSVGDVVVVDNSRDEATERLVQSTTAGRVRYVDPGGNIGFARACNLGARLTGDPVVLFLNPDVRLTRSVAPLVDRCAADPSGIWAGGLTTGCDDDLANARSAVTLGVELRRSLLGSRASLRSLAAGEATVRVDQVDGAMLALSRQLFNQLDGFDERFELYYEDVDICARARMTGAVSMDTRVFGVHASGASARTVAGRSYCVFRVSRVRYFAKLAGRPGALGAVLVGAVEVVVRTITRQPEGWGVRWRALRMSGSELLRPGTVRVLDAPDPTRREVTS